MGKITRILALAATLLRTDDAKKISTACRRLFAKAKLDDHKIIVT